MRKSILKDKASEHYNKLMVYAISSAESDLRICMLLNRILKINLALADDCEITFRDLSVRFRKYSYEAEEIEEKINLYVNRNNVFFLFPELKKIDYVLIIQTEVTISGIENALRELKNEAGVTVLSKLDPGSLRSLSKII